MKLHIATSLDAVDPRQWNRLAGDDPFLQHAFLHALHETGCASADTGWAAHYLLLHENNALTGAMPLYLKDHSYGEYVFDWAWADAHHRHGIAYYPKLLCAVPFTPVTGSRLLARDAAHRDALVTGALDLALQTKTASLHVLYPHAADLECLVAHGFLLRQGRQFHWKNAGYTDFDAFLAELSHDKRKKIRQERRKVREAGITFRRIEGHDIDDADWRFFVRCYRQTYREHHASPYLNLEFFRRIGAAMPDNIVLMLAERDGHRIAASLMLRSTTHLYGRYWGAVEHHPLLHFEACYYQGIEYAIDHGIAVFEGGAQGEHKMARGLLPVTTQSAHWLAHPGFANAIEHFLERETTLLEQHDRELALHTPFRSGHAQDE